jgi:hypothetical protein
VAGGQWPVVSGRWSVIGGSGLVVRVSGRELVLVTDTGQWPLTTDHCSVSDPLREPSICMAVPVHDRAAPCFKFQLNCVAF